MLPGLSSLALRQQRQAGRLYNLFHLFSRCKYSENRAQKKQTCLIFFAEVPPIFEVYLKDTDFYAIEEIFACNNKFGIKKELLIM